MGQSGASPEKECLAITALVPTQTRHLEMWSVISSMLAIGLTVKSASASTASQKDLSVLTPCWQTSSLEHCMKGVSWKVSMHDPKKFGITIKRGLKSLPHNRYLFKTLKNPAHLYLECTCCAKILGKSKTVSFEEYERVASPLGDIVCRTIRNLEV